jgi:UPF0755 protein
MHGRLRTFMFRLCAGSALFFILAVIGYSRFFGPAGDDATKIEFVVTPNEPLATVAADLKSDGLVRSEWAFMLAYLREGRAIRAGGYEISTTMDAWSVADTLGNSPYLAWVVVKPGMRFEEIGDLLANQLSWTKEERAAWSAIASSTAKGYEDGVYFPDTYLIPSDQPPVQVAARLADRFSQVTEPYLEEAAKDGLKWSTVLTIASLIEREAAGPDMKLISGIIRNRLEKNMALQLDDTLQYVKGSTDNWWPVVHSEDKYLDSPFNTYEHTGLPPHPIANVPLAAIDAALNPEVTHCLYYLHDNTGQIHCSPNYAGQLQNVNKYLK